MIDLLPNGAQFVSGSSDGLIRLWDIESGDVIRDTAGMRTRSTVCRSALTANCW